MIIFSALGELIMNNTKFNSAPIDKFLLPNSNEFTCSCLAGLFYLGDVMPKFIDLTGKKFGRLTVVKKHSQKDSANKLHLSRLKYNLRTSFYILCFGTKEIISISSPKY